jgi:hypothetical protein
MEVTVLHTDNLPLAEWFMEVTELPTEGRQMDVPFMVVMDQYVEHHARVDIQIAGNLLTETKIC